VTRVLHQVSAFLFYVLGTSFFVAYILVRNGIGGIWPAWWLQAADLPLIASAVVYGGLSLFLSLQTPRRSGKTIGLMIAIPLMVFFIFVLVMNFWPVLR
jgi:hypothetical protein